jgi:dTDP-L-rhamnose 4-epimerase
VRATIRTIDIKGLIVEVFNAGSGKATGVITVAETMQRLIGVSISIEAIGKFRFSGIRHKVAHLSKIKKILGFVPLVLIDRGMREFVRWEKTEVVQAEKYDQSLGETREKRLLKSLLS